MSGRPVHIFWDHSNLFLSALDACDDRGKGFEPGHRWDARLHFQNVYDFACAGRAVERAVAVGSIPPGLTSLWERLKAAGVDIELQERGAESGKEQAVDEALQLHMLRSLADRLGRPAVAVILTGDKDFHADIQRLLDAGWGVEILCFGRSFSNALKGLAKTSHGRAKWIDLDGWYKQLVYLQGLDDSGIMRSSEPLNLTGRPQVYTRNPTEALANYLLEDARPLERRDEVQFREVELLRDCGVWGAGTRGIVVDAYADDATVEIVDAQGRTLQLLTLAYDAFSVLERNEQQP